MSLKIRIAVMQFLQFFVWGSWLITIGAWWFVTKRWSGADLGATFSTLGLSSLVMPALLGIVADRWVNAEKLYGALHILGAFALAYVPQVDDPTIMFWVMLVNMIFYMPTIALSITVSYTSMSNAGMNIVKEYPPIRVWGTIGFIAALWTVSLLGFETSSTQFYIASGASIVLGIYGLTMPKCPPASAGREHASLMSALGLDAFGLFKDPKMAMFFAFTMLLGAALQLTNMYGDAYLHDFSRTEAYAHAFAVEHPAILMSVSQISETVFILTIPFFLHRFGIKKVMLLSMVGWVLRFGLFAYGDPASGLWMLVLSMIVYGVAFDFFNISASLFVETQVQPSMRSSAQGLFMMMTNGLGAILGASASGAVIDRFFTSSAGEKNWQGIWLTFTAYAAVVTLLFTFFFKHEHKKEELASATLAH